MDKITTAKHPSINWVYGPLTFAPGEGMAAKIGAFRIEVKINSDRASILYILQADINGLPFTTDLRGLPSGDPVDLENALDRCVGFLKRRLEGALDEIGNP